MTNEQGAYKCCYSSECADTNVDINNEKGIESHLIVKSRGFTVSSTASSGSGCTESEQGGKVKEQMLGAESFCAGVGPNMSEGISKIPNSRSAVVILCADAIKASEQCKPIASAVHDSVKFQDGAKLCSASSDLVGLSNCCSSF